MVRKATLNDAQTIFSLIEDFSRKGVMLFRPLSEICDNIRDFYVYDEGGSVLGAASLHIWGLELGEIRSLAVKEGHTGIGIGSALVGACLEEARSLGLKKVFALTYKTAFFERMRFAVIDKMVLPQKIWGDCYKCSKFESCDETAVIIELQGA